MNSPMVIGPAAAILRGEPNRSLLHHATFRPDIEGLRGVSVLAVVLYHAFPTAVPGGFVGVDVFFVISGFLITQLLLRELEATGGIDLVELGRHPRAYASPLPYRFWPRSQLTTSLSNRRA